MASRIGSIIAIADMKVMAVLDALPDGKAKSNNEAINGVCRALINRKTPLLPTARLVSEEGGKANPHFPVERTIFNTYSKVIRIWKKAYYDIMNIDADAPLAVNDVKSIDTSVLDSTAGNLVERLKEIVFETTQRCNVLKQIIDEGVRVSGDGFPEGIGADEIVISLGNWLRGLSNSAFEIDDSGLKVSRKTPPGTRIMDRGLLDDIKTLTENYERVQKSRGASKAD